LSTIAELLVKIGADNSGLKRTLSDSQSSVQNAFSTVPITNFTSAISGATSGISGMIGKLSGLTALAAGGFGLGAIVGSAVGAGEAVHDLSERFGISTAEAVSLARVLKLTEGDSASFASAMMRLDKNFTASGEAGEKTRATLALFGVSLTDSTGKLLPLTEQLANLSKGYKLAQANGLQQEFVMETLGTRGMALVKTLEDYQEASEKAALVKGVGLDPERLHELHMNMEVVSIQAGQLGLAFAGALAPVAEELFPPIMSGLQSTAAFLAENKENIVELTTAALELAAAYKGVQLLGSVAGTIAAFWQNAVVQATAAAAAQEVAAAGLTAAQERAIARTIAASDKMYAKMQADAVKTAQAAGLSAEETAAVISAKCVQIAEAGTVAATKIRTEMTTAFMAQAEAARLAAVETAAANKMVAVSATTAAAAELEMAAATAAQGNAAVVAGQKTAGAMATARAAAGNFLSGLWSLAGGWLGVAVATGFAIKALVEYLDGLHKVQSYDPKAEVWDDPNRPGKHLVGRRVAGQWVDAPGTEMGGYYMPEHTERIAMTDAEEEEHAAWQAWSDKQKNQKPWLQNGDGVDPDLASKMSAILADSGKGTKVHDKAAEIQRANAQAVQLMADLNKRIAGDSEIAYDAAMSNITAEVQRMNNQVADITRNGGDASGLADKIAEYQNVASAKVVDTWRRAWQDVKDQAALVNAQLRHDKMAEADAEYQIVLTRIEKERKAELDAIAKNGSDKEAQNQANADAEAKRRAAAEKRDYTKGDILLQQDRDAIESASLMVNIAGKTQAEVDAIQQAGLRKYIDDLNAQLAAAGDNADRRLAIQRQLSDAIAQQNNIAAKKMETAWSIALSEIKNQQTNYADIIVNTWNDIHNTTASVFDKMVDEGKSATDILRDVFQTVVADIEKMFLRMWTEKYIMGPLQEIFGGIIGGAFGGSSAGSGSKVSRSVAPASSPYIPNPGSIPLSAYADGGAASGWAIVGEEGPELAYFGNTAHIYTAGQSAALIGSAQAGAGSPNVNVNVVNRSGQQLSVSQQAKYDPATHTLLMQMFVDGISRNIAGSRDLLFGRG
jgi:polyhydroxyalkanoate synthesis regulator phasin